MVGQPDPEIGPLEIVSGDEDLAFAIEKELGPFSRDEEQGVLIVRLDAPELGVQLLDARAEGFQGQAGIIFQVMPGGPENVLLGDAPVIAKHQFLGNGAQDCFRISKILREVKAGVIDRESPETLGAETPENELEVIQFRLPFKTDAVVAKFRFFRCGNTVAARESPRQEQKKKYLEAKNHLPLAEPGPSCRTRTI